MVIGLNEYCSELIMNKQIQILESYIYDEDILSEAMDFAYDTILESSVLLEATTNRDMLTEFKIGVSEAKNFIRQGKKYLRKGDKESAKKSFSQAVSRLDDLEKYLRNIDDFGTGSKILGTIAGILISITPLFIFNKLNEKIRRKYLDKENSKINDKISDIEDAISYDKEDIRFYSASGNTEMVNQFVKSRNKKYKEIDELNLVKDDIYFKSIDDSKRRSFVANILNIVKITKEIVQICKNGGTEKGFNVLRSKLIVYVRDIKSVLKLFYR